MATKLVSRGPDGRFQPFDLNYETLQELWADHMALPEFPGYVTYGVRNAFLLRCEELGEEVAFCDDCEIPHIEPDENLTTVQNGYRICESCLSDGGYYRCDSCEEFGRGCTTTVDNDEVCESCLDSSAYSYCDQCEIYYHTVDTDEHDHTGCDCEAPGQTFTIRNDGEAPLSNDARATISLPIGLIAQEGIEQIKRVIYRDTDSADSPTWGIILDIFDKIEPVWQTKGGNFTKRVARAFYQNNAKIKLSAEVISTIGVIARNFTSVVSEMHVEFTRNLNLPASDFYHVESCWWGGYSESRCALKTNGGLGMRSFTTPESGKVTGRAWVMPVKFVEAVKGGESDALLPTFDTENPAGFVVFNGYGDLDGYTPARIMAHMAGMSYKKIPFEGQPMYVNSGGYLIAPQDILETFNDGVSWSLDEHSHLHVKEGIPA